MYLVDTSVLIDFLKGVETPKSRKFEEILMHQIPFGISAFTYQEVLQGAKNTKEYDKLNTYLSTQKIVYPTQESYEKAAKLFFTCRKSGITIRSTIDTLIATTAVEHNLILLHSDRNFDNMAGVIGLRVE
ncbi:MAG TPA: PIN domain nuclease [Sulfurovum sp.]|nr:PIN domain nuclease [Sulfurovum sp.]